jgi:hypothetical protein
MTRKLLTPGCVSFDQNCRQVSRSSTARAGCERLQTSVSTTVCKQVVSR